MNRITTSPEARVTAARQASAALDELAGSALRALNRHARAWDLSEAKLAALEVLADQESGCCCLYDIGDCLGVSRPNVTKLMDGLQRQGLVERRPHARDGRKIEAHLTARGRAVLADAGPGRESVITDLWAGLEDAELTELTRLLRAAAEDQRESTAT